MSENWRPVCGYEGLYEVSDVGNVRRNGVNLRLIRRRDGYLVVNLANSGRVKQIPVHRLVLKAFALHDPVRPFCNHRDGVRSNNRIENLEWVTTRENAAHMCHVLGTIARGETSGRSKLTNAAVREMRAIYAEGIRTLKEIGDQFGVSISTVHHAVSRLTWKHLD